MVFIFNTMSKLNNSQNSKIRNNGAEACSDLPKSHVKVSRLKIEWIFDGSQVAQSMERGSWLVYRWLDKLADLIDSLCKIKIMDW
jgi:hypothetical protein